MQVRFQLLITLFNIFQIRFVGNIQPKKVKSWSIIHDFIVIRHRSRKIHLARNSDPSLFKLLSRHAYHMGLEIIQNFFIFAIPNPIFEIFQRIFVCIFRITDEHAVQFRPDRITCNVVQFFRHNLILYCVIIRLLFHLFLVVASTHKQEQRQ